MWSGVLMGTTVWCLSAVFAQEPGSPCPEVFQYNLRSDGIWQGQITIIPPVQTLRITIRVQLYLTSALANKYVGHLSLSENKDTIAAKIIKGNIPKIRYTLLFPLTKPLPTIDRIYVNGETICIGPRVSAPVLTKISLEHTLIAAVSPIPGRGEVIPNSNPPLGMGENPHPMMPWYAVRPTPHEVKIPMQPSQTMHLTDSPPIETPFVESQPHEQSVSQSVNPQQQQQEQQQPPSPWTTDLQKQQTMNPPTQIEGNPQEISVPIPSKPPQPQTHQFVGQTTKEVCGRSVLANELIFHGKRTARGEWPWIAAIFFIAKIGNLQFQCGGTLINKRHLVTAGHCVKQRDEVGSFLDVLPSNLLVFLGIYSLIPDAYSQTRQVQEIFIHPDFQKTPSYDADIAVLKLAASVEYTQYVRPICLWPFISDLGRIIGKLGTVVGWGSDELGHTSTNEPRRTDVPIVSESDCLRNKTEFVTITSERTFCAGFQNNSGPCNGDSGSGLVLRYTLEGVSRWFLRGVTSVSLYDPNEGRCDLKNFVVFSDVAKFGKWMQQFEKNDNF